MIEDTEYTVYKHTAPNGKVYIGITKQKPEQRWRNGNGYKNNKHFYNAILKYGWKNIKHEIICQAPLSSAQVGAVEKSFIHLYDSTNPDKGYNNSIGGECGTLGVHPSDETRRKISEANKRAYILNPELRRKISESQKGRIPWNKGQKGVQHHSSEARKKMSESRKGANSPNYGKHLSNETRLKISEANKGKPSPFKGKHHSAETRLKLSESKKGQIPGNQKAIICVETGILYSSGKEAAESIGVTNGAISLAVRGKRKTAGGYHWKYVEEQS